MQLSATNRRGIQSSYASAAAGDRRGLGRERLSLPVAGDRNDITPNNSAANEENFGWNVVSRRNKNRPIITGKKRGTGLRVMKQIKLTRVFFSRLLLDMSAEEVRVYVGGFLTDDFEIVKLKSKYPTYSSFVITCDEKHRETLMNPDEWEEGILLRPFIGKLGTNNDSQS